LHFFTNGDFDRSEDCDIDLSCSFNVFSSDIDLLSSEEDLELPLDFSRDDDLDLEFVLDLEGLAERRDDV